MCLCLRALKTSLAAEFGPLEFVKRCFGEPDRRELQ